MIPNGELMVGGYLRNHEDVTDLEARVAGTTPATQLKPWVRLTQLDARNVSNTTEVEHLVEFAFQLDCYAGKTAMDAHQGQAEAWDLCHSVRAALVDMPNHDDLPVTVSRVAFTNEARIPDAAFEPARERVVLDATVAMHV